MASCCTSVSARSYMGFSKQGVPSQGIHRQYKGTLLGTPHRENQEYGWNVMICNDPGRYIPMLFLLYSCLGFPKKFLYITRGSALAWHGDRLRETPDQAFNAASTPSVESTDGHQQRGGERYSNPPGKPPTL